jgi:predicted phage terminase large subunit-like protein
MKYSTWPEVQKWIPWEMVIPSQRYRQELSWEPHEPFALTFLHARCKVYIKGLKDPDSARGPNINWLWYDEGQRDRTGMGWKIAIASVRIGKSPQAWVTATPGGTRHWMYEFFIKKNISEEVLKMFADISDRPLVEAFYGTLEGNKQNLDPEFYASLLAAYPSGYLRQQEVEGMFIDETGVLGDSSWFNGKVVQSSPYNVRNRVRYWDLAATEKKMIPGRGMNDPDETVGTLMSFDGENFYIEDQVYGAWEWKSVQDKIVETANRDGSTVKIYVEKEPGAGGKNQVAQIAATSGLEYFHVIGHAPEGDKVMRANVWFAEAAMGKFYMVNGLWHNHFFDQLNNFPTPYYHDDTIDSVSGARHVIAPIRQWSKPKFLHV